jgi:hypothetical protein
MLLRNLGVSEKIPPMEKERSRNHTPAGAGIHPSKFQDHHRPQRQHFESAKIDVFGGNFPCWMGKPRNMHLLLSHWTISCSSLLIN